jgi:hypothetical protein
MFNYSDSILNYSEELSPYQHGNLKLQEVLTVGWLNDKNFFQTGKVMPEVIDKLREILAGGSNYLWSVSVNAIRGHASCPICEEIVAFMIHDGNTISSSEINEVKRSERNAEMCVLGCREIWIPNFSKRNNYFSAHDLIYHYIVDHHYLPPKDFINSVLSFNINSDFVAEKEYANCIRKYEPNFISIAEMLEI